MIDQLIDHFGGLQKTAEAFNVKAPSVHEWRKRRQVPAARCLEAERLTGGALTRYDLRPDVFGDPPAAQGEAA